MILFSLVSLSQHSLYLHPFFLLLSILSFYLLFISLGIISSRESFLGQNTTQGALRWYQYFSVTFLVMLHHEWQLLPVTFESTEISLVFCWPLCGGLSSLCYLFQRIHIYSILLLLGTCSFSLEFPTMSTININFLLYAQYLLRYFNVSNQHTCQSWMWCWQGRGRGRGMVVVCVYGGEQRQADPGHLLGSQSIWRAHQRIRRRAMENNTWCSSLASVLTLISKCPPIYTYIHPTPIV